jgi:hypothetical protein
MESQSQITNRKSQIANAMDLDPTWLLLSMIPSGAGFVLFMYGKKQERMPQLVVGLLMMVYPYFVSTASAMTVVGLLLWGALWYALRLGW